MMIYTNIDILVYTNMLIYHDANIMYLLDAEKALNMLKHQFMLNER